MNNGHPPAIVHGTFYATTNSCIRSLIVLLNAGTGASVWSSQVENAFAGMAVGNGIVAIITDDGGVNDEYALSASSGGLWWTTGGSGPDTVPAYPAIAYGLFYAPIAGDIYAFKLKVHGLRKIIGLAGGQEVSVSIAANGVLYTQGFGQLYAFSALNHFAILWDSGDTNTGVPIVVNGVVYGACNGSNVCAWALPGSLRRRH